MLVARGENPAEIRRSQREQAHSAKTVETLAKLDLTVHFKTPWEKPGPLSCQSIHKSFIFRVLRAMSALLSP